MTTLRAQRALKAQGSWPCPLGSPREGLLSMSWRPSRSLACLRHGSGVRAWGWVTWVGAREEGTPKSKVPHSKMPPLLETGHSIGVHNNSASPQLCDLNHVTSPLGPHCAHWYKKSLGSGLSWTLSILTSRIGSGCSEVCLSLYLSCL